MREFVRYGLDHVVDRLLRFAPGADIAGRSETYVLHGPALIAEREVEADAGLLMAIAARHGRIRRVSLPFSALRITVQVHARIYGLCGSSSMTAKVALIEPMPGKSFFRDVRARRMVEPFLAGSGMSVPAIVRADPARGWLVEEFVEGADATEADLARYLAQSACLYTPTVRVKPLSTSPQNRLLIAALKTVLSRIAPPLAAVADDAWWPTVFCHGDITTSNVLSGAEGRLWLIDWEAAKFYPLAAELGWMYVAHPVLKMPILGLIARLTPDDRRLLSPVSQLAVGAALALKRRQRLRDVTVRQSTQSGEKSPEAAVAKFERQMARARDAIADLAT
jgi:hypothetical protein